MSNNEIIVYCDNKSDRHGKKHPHPVVHRFRYDESHKDGTGQGWLDHYSTRRLRKVKAQQHSAQMMIGDEKFNHRKHTLDNRDEWADELRETWELPCDKCGFYVLVTDEKLYPILHRMCEIGVDRIGLRALERGLKGTSR